MIINNLYSMQCLDCLDVVVSLTRHDFQACRCGNAFIDGGQGNAYFRVAGNNRTFWGTWRFNKKTLARTFIKEQPTKEKTNDSFSIDKSIDSSSSNHDRTID